MTIRRWPKPSRNCPDPWPPFLASPGIAAGWSRERAVGPRRPALIDGPGNSSRITSWATDWSAHFDSPARSRKRTDAIVSSWTTARRSSRYERPWRRPRPLVKGATIPRPNSARMASLSDRMRRPDEARAWRRLGRREGPAIPRTDPRSFGLPRARPDRDHPSGSAKESQAGHRPARSRIAAWARGAGQDQTRKNSA